MTSDTNDPRSGEKDAAGEPRPAKPEEPEGLKPAARPAALSNSAVESSRSAVPSPASSPSPDPAAQPVDPAASTPGGGAGAPPRPAPSASGEAGAPTKPPAPPPPKKPAAVAPAPQIPRTPGGAAKLAKAATIVADKEQEPLAGSADLGWWVLNTVMMVGLVVLAGIVLYSCANVGRALWDMM